MAKVEAGTVDARRQVVAHFRSCIGRAIRRARELHGWNLDELAHAIDRDPRQVRKWEQGQERQQLEILLAVESFRQPLLIAFCEQMGTAVELETIVHVKRAVAR